MCPFPWGHACPDACTPAPFSSFQSQVLSPQKWNTPEIADTTPLHLSKPIPQPPVSASPEHLSQSGADTYHSCACILFVSPWPQNGSSMRARALPVLSITVPPVLEQYLACRRDQLYLIHSHESWANRNPGRVGSGEYQVLLQLCNGSHRFTDKSHTPSPINLLVLPRKRANHKGLLETQTGISSDLTKNSLQGPQTGWVTSETFVYLPTSDFWPAVLPGHTGNCHYWGRVGGLVGEIIIIIIVLPSPHST